MSGTSGGSFNNGFESSDSCDALSFETQLNSPKDEVVDNLLEGSLLEVVITQSGSTTIVAAVHDGKIAGGIAAPQVQRLRECLLGGTQYCATVLSVNGGQVRIRVAAK